ncbi:NlpC/P60 family protein [Amycolatopsis acidicola]|uniref:NlpC/P60 family protein n=1 Tax=Amycolatopsis acidicola TaxID=2596893 RepID=A0A5N0V2U3_9PSEU|nr:C40 family peptidase [Amycolatopsis acidicola]KAA9159449.1 NlpC/P60 family protein [Amycolatopsis acidicola]
MGRIAAAGAVFVVVLIVLIGSGAIGVVQAVFGSSGGSMNCAPAGATATSAVGYGPAEMSNAATIVAVGKRMNVPEQGWVIAITTAITESQLQNRDGGDRDSVGLFQQRPSQGWGTVAQIMDPAYSSEQFYQRLTVVPNWQTMPVAQVAQTVQRSGFPDRYAKYEQVARQIVGAVQGATCSISDTSQIPVTGRAKLVIDAALSQLGVPYAWGGGTVAGPSQGIRDGGVADQHGDYAKIGFDCSGLTLFAYAQAGISLPHQSQGQFTLGTPVPLSAALAALRPADLVFYSPGAIHHVGIYLGNGLMVNAYESGTVVRVQPIDLSEYAGAVRLL